MLAFVPSLDMPDLHLKQIVVHFSNNQQSINDLETDETLRLQIVLRMNSFENSNLRCRKMAKIAKMPGFCCCISMSSFSFFKGTLWLN